MDQEKIGKFIANLRKEKNLTQKELALKLGVTDKSVSKWETGKCMPDLSLFPILCKELDVSINELLSGEKIEENYQNKLEENIIINIVSLKKKIKKMIIIIIGIFMILILFILVFIISSNIGYQKIYLNYNQVKVSVCEHKHMVTLLTETVDNTPLLLDFVSDENLSEYEFKAYKFRNNKYMKDFSTKNINIFDHDIEHIKFNDKIIYSNGDELEDCDL